MKRSGPLGQRASTFAQQTPELSERESIFALHYTPSQDELSTPAGEGANALSFINRLLPVTEMEVAEALPAAPRTPPENTKQSVSQRQIHKNILPRPNSNLIAEEDKSASFSGISRGTEQGVRRVASEGLSWTKRVPLPISKTGRTHQRAMESARSSRSPPTLHDDEYYKEGRPPLDHLVRPSQTILQDLPDPTRTGPSKDDASDAKISSLSDPNLEQTFYPEGSPEKPRIHQSSLKQALQGSRSERSTSRGRSHIEKSIEATLANVEPGKNVRSRKASHVMGIFRENIAAEENKKPVFRRQESVLEQTDTDEKIREVALKTSSPTSILPKDEYFTKTASTPLLDDLDALQSTVADTTPVLSDAPHTELKDSVQEDIDSFTQDKTSKEVSPLRPSHDPYFRKHDLLKHAESSQSSFPAGLLREIRDHHSVIPLRTQGTVAASGTFRSPESGENSHFVDRRQIRPEGAEKHDEDEEHMYQMVYYPHPGPTAEEIAKFKSPGDESPEIEPLEGSRRQDGDTTQDMLATDPGLESIPSEHIDISFQSKHGKSVFHGDYYPGEDELQEERVTAKPEQLPAAALSASESEPESGDEFGHLSQTDEGETTPTATPKQPSHLLSRKKADQEGPKGAVILQPYNHQVGGHSQIYALTKRAIMKQLNNRENEFYELIERNHPDMLKFLPM